MFVYTCVCMHQHLCAAALSTWQKQGEGERGDNGGEGERGDNGGEGERGDNGGEGERGDNGGGERGETMGGRERGETMGGRERGETMGGGREGRQWGGGERGDNFKKKKKMYKSPSFNQPKYDYHLVGTQMIRQDLIENEMFDRQMVHMDHNKTGPLGSDLPKAEWCLATAALAGSAVPAVSGAHTLVWTNTPAMHTEGCHTLAQSHCNLDKHTCNAHRRVSHTCTVTLQFGQTHLQCTQKGVTHMHTHAMQLHSFWFGQTHLQCTQKGVTHMHSCIPVWTNTPAMHTEGCHTHAVTFHHCFYMTLTTDRGNDQW